MDFVFLGQRAGISVANDDKLQTSWMLSTYVLHVHFVCDSQS